MCFGVLEVFHSVIETSLVFQSAFESVLKQIKDAVKCFITFESTSRSFDDVAKCVNDTFKSASVQ